MVGESYINDIDKEGWGKESNTIIVIIRMREGVWAAGESIQTSQEFPWNMNHLQVKVSKVDEPPGLLAIKGLGGMEVGEVFMVGKDLYRKKGAVEVVHQDFRAWMTARSFLS